MAEIEVLTFTVSMERMSPHRRRNRGPLTHKCGANGGEKTSAEVPWHAVSDLRSRHQSSVEGREGYIMAMNGKIRTAALTNCQPIDC